MKIEEIGKIYIKEDGCICLDFDEKINTKIINTNSIEGAEHICDAISDYLNEVYDKNEQNK